MRVDFDRGPVMVNGPIRGYRARVVIADGILHVVHSGRRVDKLRITGELAVDEVRGGRGFEAWTVETEQGLVLINNKGCSGCGYRLSSVPISTILGT